MTKRLSLGRLLLLGLGLLSSVVVGVAVYNSLSGPADSPPAVELAWMGNVTARGAFDPAARLAAQWQEDAQLAAVSGHWSEADLRQRGDAEWAFQFFSPSTQRLALIIVTDGAARVVRDSLSPYQVPTFSDEKAWRVDSDQALRTWWDTVGSAVAARFPDMTLTMQLRRRDEGNGDPVWTVVGLVFGTESVFTVVVNGTDGALMEP